MSSKTGASVLIYGSMLLMGGCAATLSGPLPSNGEIDVIAKGNHAALASFDAKLNLSTTGCKRTEDGASAAPKSAQDLEERAYHCEIPMLQLQQVDSRVQDFAQAYAQTLIGGAQMAKASAAGGSSGTGVALEMIITTGTGCKSMSCGGGPLLFWETIPPCWKLCTY
jgi:hypothetical protein